MKKKMMSLALAVVMCMSLCVPAFAAGGNDITPMMRNSDYDTAPPRGTQAYAYNIFLNRSYGNLETEQLISQMATGGIFGYITAGISSVIGAGAGGFFAGAGAPLLQRAANLLKSEAGYYAPNSTIAGYVIDTFGYNGQEPPLEHYYKYVVHYYPEAVSSSGRLPDGDVTVTFYEFNWFS